ncbi:MAG: hypothetical protein EBQ92_04005, partial [Proteobacteria bacterium]|nr:hypothetical protein [Pseudomonadota bacterium]
MAGKDPAAILQKIKSNDQWGVARSLIIIQDASTNDPSSDEISNMIGCITTDRGTLNTRIKSHESELKNVQSDSDKNDENIIKLKNHYKKLGQELRELEESIRKLKVRYRELNEEKNYCESDEFDLYEYYAELSRYCANLAWCLKVQ